MTSALKIRRAIGAFIAAGVLSTGAMTIVQTPAAAADACVEAFQAVREAESAVNHLSRVLARPTGNTAANRKKFEAARANLALARWSAEQKC